MDIALFLFASLWLIAVTMRLWLYAKTHLWVETTAHEWNLVNEVVSMCVSAGADQKRAAEWLARYHIILPEPLLDTVFKAQRGDPPRYSYSKN